MFGSCSITSLSFLGLGSRFESSYRPLSFRFSTQEDIGHMVLFSWYILQVSLAVLHEGLSALALGFEEQQAPGP